MRILNIGLFLLLGACSVASDGGPAEPVVENFGGDINSPNGQAWLANTFLKGRPWSVVNNNGSWVKSQEMNPILDNGDIRNFVFNPPLDYVFVGAPSPTTAFYRRPRYVESSTITIESRLEGFFVTNFKDLDGADKTFIYPAALKLTKAETDKIKVRVGIPASIVVEQGTADQQKRYNDIVHVPSNYDLTRPAKDNPQAIIEKP